MQQDAGLRLKCLGGRLAWGRLPISLVYRATEWSCYGAASPGERRNGTHFPTQDKTCSSHPGEAGRASRANQTNESTCTDLTSSQPTQHYGPSQTNPLWQLHRDGN